jgi:hypothetical protein
VPKTLLLNASHALYEYLAKTAPGEIVAAVTSDTRRYDLELPPPSNWDLAIYCFVGSGDAYKPEGMLLPSNYLEEVDAPTVRFGKMNPSFATFAYESYEPFEVHGEGPDFDSLRDLFAEKLNRFRPGVLRETANAGGVREVETGVVARSTLGGAAAVRFTMDARETLILPYPGDAIFDQADIIEHLLLRTLPKLYPAAYFDEYIPERVRALDAERDRILKESQMAIRAIDEAKEEELAYFAPFRPLPRLRDDALKRLVHEALEALGFEVTDLDEDDGKDALDVDLLARADGLRIYVETRGAGNRNCRDEDLERFDDNIAKAEARLAKAHAKLMIFNGQLNRKPKERGPTFSASVENEAKIRGMCLATGSDLLHLIERVRAEVFRSEDARAMLSAPGRLRVP